MRMADQMGLSSRAVQLDLHEFAALTTPAILHWDLAHFVVLERVEKERFLIHDPGGSSKWMAPAELSKHFTGVALELAPTKGVFEPGDYREALKLSDLWSKINGTSQAMTQVVILSVLVQFFALSGPYFIQLAFDLALPNKDEAFLWILAACFAGAVALSGATVYLRATVLLSLEIGRAHV
jgi:ATP-binding cassette subfamily B protein RaxB